MLAVIGAMDEEVQAIQGAISGMTVHNMLGCKIGQGDLDGVPILVVRSGIGKVNAALATAALANSGASRIVFTGMAGGVGPDMHIGDVVVATDLIQHDFDLSAQDEYSPGQIPGEPASWAANPALSDALAIAASELGPTVHRGRVASGDQFIWSAQRANQIRDQFGAMAVEMEGAAVAQVCSKLGIPFGVLRWISDSANEDATIDFPAFVSKIADLDLSVLRALVSQ
jgi:adenosylhomocysteine nucleosidase